MSITFKVRITSPGPDEAELLRAALKAAFGDKLTLNKARKGGNPKYAHLPDVLAYGELEFTQSELEAAARGPQGPAYTQATISLASPRRKKVRP